MDDTVQLMKTMGIENHPDGIVDKEQMDKLFSERRTPQGQIEHERTMAFDVKGGVYNSFTSALDERLKTFFAANPLQKSFPAVDLASGAAVYPVQYALRYRGPFFPASLEWTSTDWDHYVDSETRPAIKIMAKEVVGRYPLFRAGTEWWNVVHPQDKVELVGLRKKEFNGLKGYILGRDNTSKGRVRVQLDSREKPLSFNAENIGKVRETSKETLEFLVEREMIYKGEDKAFFAGLLKRTTVVDIQEHETWTEIAQHDGKCALVTCTSLLTGMGHRGPTAWQDVLELASKLLAPGGYLLTHDTEKWGGYGNTAMMEQFIATKSLDLKLEDRSEPVWYDDNDGHMFLLVWRKGNEISKLVVPSKA